MLVNEGQDESVESRQIKTSRKNTGKDAVLDQIRGLRSHFEEFWSAGLCPERVVVEAQQYYKGGPNAGDLLNLALVAGGAIAECVRWWPTTTVMVPLPAEWKGQIPKAIHHARIMGRLGLSAEYSIHEFDAIGMALWARDQIIVASPRSPSR